MQGWQEHAAEALNFRVNLTPFSPATSMLVPNPVQEFFLLCGLDTHSSLMPPATDPQPHPPGPQQLLTACCLAAGPQINCPPCI